MSVMEKQALDMSALLLRAYELGDMILASEEAMRYLAEKERLSGDPAAQELIGQLGKKRELFEECQRFGHFHPEYHKAMDAVKEVQDQLDALPNVQAFKEAEKSLDGLLYDISALIAGAVSDTVKVPSNDPLPKEGGCSSGGSCSGRCG
ncbi:MAG: regulatory protein YlbF [Paenibacillaceae bacterium]|nr:regulatory protein YlbF [Paenibacillaceae bacterium]